MRKILLSFLVLSLLGLFLPVYAAPASGQIFSLPQAAQNSPVISLGTAVDPVTHELVEGYAIVHYKKGQAKPGAGNGSAKVPKCYGFLASGAKWKAVENWEVNPNNIRGLGSSFVLNNLTADIAKWEDAADGVVGNSIFLDILGSGLATTSILVADSASPDGQNEVYFANVLDSSAIAVTIVWGIFSGPTFNRKLVEWDQIYDDVDYDWSATGATGKMDFENIATHELGHSVGLADLYNSVCGEETMYGYAQTGETQKRSLNTGDILGVSTLY